MITSTTAKWMIPFLIQIMRFYFVIILLVLASCAHAQDKTTLILTSKDILTESHKWNVQSVELRDDCTIVEKYVCPVDEEPTWICSNSSEFIEDSITGEKYYLTGSDIGLEEGKVLLHNKSMTFKEYYPALPKNVKYLNISTGSKYFIESVDLSLERYPALPPISEVIFFDIPLATSHKEFLKGLKKHGFKTFYTEEEEGLWGNMQLLTYLYGSIDGYDVTIEVTTDKQFQVATEVNILYQNHLDKYEVAEHLTEIEDDIKSTYSYYKLKDRTPNYMQATSILNMKSGKNRIFKNVTIVEIEGAYRLYESADAEENDFYGSITLKVHDDNIHHDRVIEVRYYDCEIDKYIRRNSGKFKW